MEELKEMFLKMFIEMAQIKMGQNKQSEDKVKILKENENLKITYIH